MSSQQPSASLPFSKRGIIYTGRAEKNPKPIYFVTWTMALILCFLLKKEKKTKKRLELVCVIYSSFKLDYSLSHCYYFRQVRFRRRNLLLSLWGGSLNFSVHHCWVPSALPVHVSTCFSLSPSLPSFLPLPLSSPFSLPLSLTATL